MFRFIPEEARGYLRDLQEDSGTSGMSYVDLIWQMRYPQPHPKASTSGWPLTIYAPKPKLKVIKK